MATLSLQELQNEEDVICAQREGTLEVLFGEISEEELLEEQVVLAFLTKMAEK